MVVNLFMRPCRPRSFANQTGPCRSAASGRADLSGTGHQRCEEFLKPHADPPFGATAGSSSCGPTAVRIQVYPYSGLFVLGQHWARGSILGVVGFVGSLSAGSVGPPAGPG
jgi:hypothetical protein